MAERRAMSEQQALLSLAQSSVVGASDFRELASPDTTLQSGLLGLLACWCAATQLGVTEDPEGSNDGPMVGQYWRTHGADKPGAWCAYFCSWAWKSAIRMANTCLATHDLDARYMLTSDTSGSTARWWHKRSPLSSWTAAEIRSGRMRPVRGDVLIRNDKPDEVHRGERGSGGHIVLVTGYGEGRAWTIEGNSRSGSWDNNGGSVVAKSIDIDDPRVVGICRIQARLR